MPETFPFFKVNESVIPSTPALTSMEVYAFPFAFPSPRHYFISIVSTGTLHIP